MTKWKQLIIGTMIASATSLTYADHSLIFNPNQYTKQTVTIDGKEISYRAYENIVYVEKPVDATYQSMNIYIPEAYFQGKTIDGYSSTTAPIFFPNQVGGYMPAKAGVAGKTAKGNNQPDTIQIALSKGYVVASAGARGRTQTYGKAPAAIVDLKAAVRYLHFNDQVMAGDANKIISNGTSAGGALSVLLGATGNNRDYEPYLKKIGAANARDDIFAVSAYCPISILDWADAAYEWQFNGVNEYQKIDISMLDYHVERKTINGSLTDEQINLSGSLKALFPSYLNSLHLKDEQNKLLTLDKNGNGSFKNYVTHYIQQSAQTALDKGEDLSSYSWININNGRVGKVDFDAYARSVGRQKTPPAFDAIDLSSGENQLFGTSNIDKRHFTAFSMQHNTAKQAKLAESKIVALMNPMHYLSNRTSTQHWRIRVGTNDRDTSLAISAILTAKLRNHGKTVDYALPWNIPHSGDYDLDELFAWMKKISH